MSCPFCPLDRHSNAAAQPNMRFMSADLSLIPFAIDRSGCVVSINDVPSGLLCNCLCASCNEPVIARKGRVRQWHFAHQSSRRCVGAFESALHLAVKQLIEQEKRVFLPHCGVIRHETAPEISFQENHGLILYGDTRLTATGHWEYTVTATAQTLVEKHRELSRCGFADIEAQMVLLESVALEQTEGSIRPDLVVHAHGQRLYIEVAVTHLINEAKLQKIRERGVGAIEIIVPADTQLDWDVLRALILNENNCTFWRYHPQAEHMAEQCYQERREQRIMLEESASRLRKLRALVRSERFEMDSTPAHINKEGVSVPAPDALQNKLDLSAKSTAVPKITERFAGRRYWFDSTNPTITGQVSVELTEREILLQAVPFHRGLANVIRAVAHEYGGRYDRDLYRWVVLPATEERLQAVFDALRRHESTLKLAWGSFQNPEKGYWTPTVRLGNKPPGSSFMV